MIWLSALWGRVWPYLAALAALGAAIIGIRQSGKAAGREEIRREQDKSVIKGMKDARDARDEIDSLDDAAVRDKAHRRLRDRAK